VHRYSAVLLLYKTTQLCSPIQNLPNNLSRQICAFGDG